jgi:HEAT repeat protein
MDTRSSFLVVGLYVLGAVVLAAIVGLAFLEADSLRQRFALDASPPHSPEDGDYLRRGAKTREEFLAAQSAAEVERLQRLLEEKNQSLEQRTVLLQQRTAEYQKLKKDFDAAAELVLQFLDGEAIAADEAAPAPEKAPDAAASAAPAEIAALREELNRTRLLENALAAEVEELRLEVLATEAEVDRIEQEARAQAAQLLAGERALREAADETLARIGEPAIAALTEALADERPAVRRWAAQVLGEIGPAASPAVGPLMEALSDRDDSVRTAAAQALRAIGARD